MQLFITIIHMLQAREILVVHNRFPQQHMKAHNLCYYKYGDLQGGDLSRPTIVERLGTHTLMVSCIIVQGSVSKCDASFIILYAFNVQTLTMLSSTESDPGLYARSNSMSESVCMCSSCLRTIQRYASCRSTDH